MLHCCNKKPLVLLHTIFVYLGKLEGGLIMKTVNRTIIFTFIVGGIIFARNGKVNPRVEEKNVGVKSEHYWVKDHASNQDNDQLNRKRSHKRRRKIRKPIKGLR